MAPLIHSSMKPIFIVSYKNVIGKHAMFSQRDVDAIYTESQALGYFPCYKASEFTTKKVWHPLRIDELAPPKLLVTRSDQSTKSHLKKKKKTSRDWRSRLIIRGINHIDVPFLQRSYERRIYHILTGWIIDAGTVRGFPRYIRAKRAIRRLYPQPGRGVPETE